jgi:hypothetical protein
MKKLIASITIRLRQDWFSGLRIIYIAAQQIMQMPRDTIARKRGGAEVQMPREATARERGNHTIPAYGIKYYHGGRCFSGKIFSEICLKTIGL